MAWLFGWFIRLSLFFVLILYFGTNNYFEQSVWYAIACVAVYYLTKYGFIKVVENIDEVQHLSKVRARNQTDIDHEQARLKLKLDNFQKMAEIAMKMREQEADISKQIWALRQQIADAEREENSEFARQMQAILSDAGLA